jgi:hydroxymethylpyrimidine/phosphomethylpyrimidine kinase
MVHQQSVPVVMTFSGLDPTGGAGTEADIEALASHGCHASPIVTAMTVQDTRDVTNMVPVDGSLIIEQARAILEDMPVAAFKIGLLGSVAVVEAVHSILHDYPDVPAVLDPVLSSGAGTDLSDRAVQDALRSLLLPMTTVLTPNSLEARALAPEADTLGACAMAILDQGCEFVLITGGHENTPKVVNTLYGNHRQLEQFRWERLAGSYHGSGCTLAASIAGLLAQGVEPVNAVHEAQEYTWESLKHGYRVGMGQFIPNRLFWAKTES